MAFYCCYENTRFSSGAGAAAVCLQKLTLKKEAQNVEPIEKKIAEAVKEHGGRAYYVGGCVRDRLLRVSGSDIDIEVHGICKEELLEILNTFGEPITTGAQFGVFGLTGAQIDICLPRREFATGRGHRDFEILVDPFLDVAEAARRRDFTVNAIMQDVLTGEIADPYHGREDLSKGILRHIDDAHFAEDPLRVFRAAQFSSRFELQIDPTTMQLCRSMDVSALLKSRVEDELKKGLLKSKKPSLFFENLRKMEQLSVWFPELECLIGLPQDPLHHPEGDVWTHTMQVLDRAAAYLDQLSDPYAFLLLALTHDFGKAVTTQTINGRIHAYGHETAGLPLAEAFLRRITGSSRIVEYVLNMLPLHMKPNVAAAAEAKLKTTNQMFDSAAAPLDLVYFALSDQPAAACENRQSADFLFSRFRQYQQTMEKPYVSGKDLIAAGIEPGADFTEILAYAHKLRLAGIEKEDALRQTVAFARKTRKQHPL